MIPRAETANGVLWMFLAHGRAIREVAFDCTIDLDDFGELIGVEILAFAETFNAHAPPSPGSGHPQWSYDPEIDAFYLRLSNGSAPRQETKHGLAGIDAMGLVISLIIDTA